MFSLPFKKNRKSIFSLYISHDILPDSFSLQKMVNYELAFVSIYIVYREMIWLLA